MIFNTWLFGLYAVICLAAYWLVVPSRMRPVFLIVSGLIFYAAAVPIHTGLIVFLAVLTYIVGRSMLSVHGGRRKALMIAGVSACVATLAFFKYTGLFVATIDPLCSNCARGFPTIAVPLAISFFTFEFVHFIVDVYLGTIRDVRAGLFYPFAFFFPTMVAGPIKRYQQFTPQLENIAAPDQARAFGHVYRIATGLAKKVIVADSMTPLTAALTAPGALYRPLDYAVAIVAYSVKIYFDFSGYSDIAIGFAGLLGLRVPENFNRPYWSSNVTDFWRRWHISLSSWIRDYIFIPLGGSRRSRAITVANLAIAMALVGLWHGAAWHFVVWGLWHGAGLATHRLWHASVAPRIKDAVAFRPVVRGLSIATTATFVSLGWVLFASPSLAAAFEVYRGLVP